MKTKLLGYVVTLLIVAQLLLVLLSWLLSSMMLEGVRSLLSSEAIRWFMGQFSEILLSPLLIWLLLLAMSVGTLRQSRILSRAVNYRERMSQRFALLLLVGYVVVILLLTAVPHAILLSSTGLLFPSPFSRALVPIIAFGIWLVSVVYGFAVKTLGSFADVCQAMQKGIAWWSPLLIIYVFFMQFYESLRFVFF